MGPDGYGQGWADARCHLCPERFDSVAALSDHLADDHDFDPCPRCGGDHDRIDRREPCHAPADVPPGLSQEEVLDLMPWGS